MRAFHVSAAVSIGAMALGSLALLVLRPGSLLVTTLLASVPLVGWRLASGHAFRGCPPGPGSSL